MMRLKVESTSKDAKKLKEKFVALASSVESENWDSGEITLVLRIILLLYLVFTHIKSLKNINVLIVLLCRYYLLILEIIDR